jgi:hypothetical protein
MAVAVAVAVAKPKAGADHLIYLHRLTKELAKDYDEVYDINGHRGSGTYVSVESLAFKSKLAFDLIKHKTVTDELYQQFNALIKTAECYYYPSANNYWQSKFQELKIFGQLKYICGV